VFSNDVSTLAYELSEVKTAEEYWAKCVRAFDSFGVTGIGYGVVPMLSKVKESSPTEATFFRHTYMPEWERVVGKERLLDDDVTTQLMYEQHEEIDWNADPDELGATKENKRLYELEQDLGLIWGKTLLLSHHSRNSVSSGIGLHVNNVCSDIEFDKYWAEYGKTLRSISELLNIGMLGQHSDAIVRLTGREKDYLYWSAMGLDRFETARRLGISENTLDKPIASAKRKLRARSTSQAVAKAVLLGLISL